MCEKNLVTIVIPSSRCKRCRRKAITFNSSLSYYIIHMFLNTFLGSVTPLKSSGRWLVSCVSWIWQLAFPLKIHVAYYWLVLIYFYLSIGSYRSEYIWNGTVSLSDRKTEEESQWTSSPDICGIVFLSVGVMLTKYFPPWKNLKAVQHFDRSQCCNIKWLTCNTCV